MLKLSRIGIIKFSQSIRTKLIIQKKTKINHDCYIYRFGWNGPKFNLKIGQHLQIVQNIKTYEAPQGQQVAKKYTPISDCSQLNNNIDILFKIYRPNTNPNFPNGGKLTPYIQSLKQGDSVNVVGPLGKFAYQKGGMFILDGVRFRKNKIFFIVGGTGVTPAYQTIKQILKNSEQKVQIIVLFANKSEEDIILRKQIEEMEPRIKLYHTIQEHKNNPKFLKGRVTKQMLQSICPLDQQQTLYCHCGPGPMNMFIRSIFKQFPKSTLFKY